MKKKETFVNDTISACVGLASSALPEVQTLTEENSQIGASTSNVHTLNLNPSSISHKPSTINLQKHWYALRCTYGREKKAYDYLLNHGVKVFYPTVSIPRQINGKTEQHEESRIPNVFFAYGSFDELKEYVYDNVHWETKYVRFYYCRHHDGTKEPLIVPDVQMKSFMLMCEAHVDDVHVKPFVVEKFLKGQHVLVKEGPFAGVEGIVARFQGQQRVGIVIDGLLTAVTAYVPSAYLERTEYR